MQNSDDDIEMEPYDVATFREFKIPGFTIKENDNDKWNYEPKARGSYQETPER